MVSSELFQFQSIPGQEDLCRWFEDKMSDPEALHEEGRSRATKLRTVIHGDLWHNNVFFKPTGGGNRGSSNAAVTTKLILTDWQMSHIGIATNDLCFLLFSSTTPRFRSGLLYFRKRPCILSFSQPWVLQEVISSAAQDHFRIPTSSFRQDNWDSTLRLYYESFKITLRTLNVSEAEFDVTFDEFLLDVKASIPISLFFCGNIQVFA
jgi:hypothetical protein